MSKNIFGLRLIDNKTGHREAMTDTLYDYYQLNNSDRIDTVSKSKDWFIKRNQDKLRMVCHFQHVSGHPLDATLVYSVVMNKIKNNLITKQQVQLVLDQLGVSKFAIQDHGKCVSYKCTYQLTKLGLMQKKSSLSILKFTSTAINLKKR